MHADDILIIFYFMVSGVEQLQLSTIGWDCGTTLISKCLFRISVYLETLNNIEKNS